MRLETDRLILRGWTDDDLDPYARIVADPEVMKFIGDGRVQGRDQAEKFIQAMRAYEQGRGWHLWAVERKADGQLLGYCGYGLLDDQLDFGWRLGREFWGQGYGTEAARAALDYGVAAYGFTEIRSVAYAENRASIRIMEKLGLRREGAGMRHGKALVYYFHRPRSLNNDTE